MLHYYAGMNNSHFHLLGSNNCTLISKILHISLNPSKGCQSVKMSVCVFLCLFVPPPKKNVIC